PVEVIYEEPCWRSGREVERLGDLLLHVHPHLASLLVRRQPTQVTNLDGYRTRWRRPRDQSPFDLIEGRAQDLVSLQQKTETGHDGRCWHTSGILPNQRHVERIAGGLEPLRDPQTLLETGHG